MTISDDIENCLGVLLNGGVILYPTDTVWGLGCDSTNSKAVKKLFRIKRRQESKSLILLSDNLSMVGRYVTDIPDKASQFIVSSKRPVTIIYPGAVNLADGIAAEDGSVGIRITNDKFCQQLIRMFQKPIVSTSANISGEKTPALFDEISAEIKDSVDYIVYHRRKDRRRHKPSPVIKINSDGAFTVLRK